MSIRAVGSSAIVRFCQEGSWGVTPTSPAKVFGVNLRSEGLGSTKNLFQSETINNKRAVIGLGDGNKGVEGDITMDLLPERQEYLFAHLLGKLPVTTGAGPTYTHTITPSTTGEFLEGLSIEKDYTNMSPALFFKYTGCRVNTCAINFIQEGFHDINFSFVGKAEKTGTYTATSPFHADEIDTPAANTIWPTKSGYTGFQTTIKIDDVALGAVVSGSINITNNVETDGYILGSAERASCAYGKRQCTGNFTVFFDDIANYNTYIAGTEVDVKFVMTNGVDTMTIHFPVCKLGGESPKIASASGLNLPMTFQARYDDVSGFDVQITIVNELTTPDA